MNDSTNPSSAFARLLYPIRSGKNSKAIYYAGAVLSMLVPPAYFRARRERLLGSIAGRPDRDEIESRAAYCCKLEPGAAPLTPPESLPRKDAPPPIRVRDQSLPRKKSVYFFDSREWLRYFPAELRFSYWPGDKTRVPAVPALVKSRPVAGDNGRSVLLNMDKIRHFLFVSRDIPFAEKDDLAIFRGTVRDKPKRIALFERHFGAPGMDLGDTSRRAVRAEWRTPEATLREQLRHKFILCIEGNDVASNLKWVMSSNSIVVMPKPEFETWFLEGLLEPGVHYVEIRPDFVDLPEKLAWYRDHPAEAEKILAAAHAWVDRFRDPARERLVSLRVLDRYFRATGQR